MLLGIYAEHTGSVLGGGTVSGVAGLVSSESAVMGRGTSPRSKSEGGGKLVVLPGLPVAQGSSVRNERASGVLSVPAPADE